MKTGAAPRAHFATLHEAWKGIPVQNFSDSSELEAWEKNWPKGDGRPAAKIIYDPAAREVRVSGRSRGTFFQRTFLLEKDDLALDIAAGEGVRSGTNENVNQTLMLYAVRTFARWNQQLRHSLNSNRLCSDCQR
jgi:hypothetical protein